MRHSRRLLSFAAAVATLTSLVSAQPAPGTQTHDPFAAGITPGVKVSVGTYTTLPNSPNGAKPRMNDFSLTPDGRSVIVDQRGPIYMLNSAGTPASFVNLASLGLGVLNDDGERGVASIAFHPQYNQAGTPGYGKFYVSFSTSNTTPTPDYIVAGQARTHDEVVYEFTTANPAVSTYVAASAPREVIRIAQPFTNHNGGGLKFNPLAVAGTNDYGALYYSLGDGGSGGDPLAQGQNNNALLGKILRINPLGTNGPSGKYGIVPDNVFAADNNASTRAEIYATGLRNPQKFSWDMGNGQMLAGDVGQGVVEEVDRITNGGNYGWGVREGSFVYVNGNTVAYPNNPDNPAYIRPIAEYDHSESVSINGGFVYRGTAIPSLTGKYVFGDLAGGRIFYVDADTTADPTVGNQNPTLRELFLTTNGSNTVTLQQLINQTVGTQSRSDLRLGQDAVGNLYLLNKRDGVVRELLPAIAVPEPTTFAALAFIALAGRRRRR